MSTRQTFRTWKEPSKRRGAAALEFAIVLPLLLLLLLGGVDLGRFAHTWISVTNAARAGAAFGGNNVFTPVSRPAWESGIRRTVQADLETLRDFDPNRLKVTIAPAVDSGDRRRVSVSVEYPFDSLVTWSSLPGTIPLRQTAVFPMTR